MAGVETKQARGYALTIHTIGDKEELKAWFMENCSRWVFQLERGTEEAKLHYQCTIELKKRTRPGALANRIRELGFAAVHVGIISSAGNKAAWDYSKKTATRVEGPWGSGQMIAEEPKSIRDINLHEWQETVIAIAKRPWSREISRKVTIIVDILGGSGKSTLMKYMSYHKIAYAIQPGEAKSMIREAQCVCDDTNSIPRTWMIDLPREKSIVLERSDFWTGIETIKNGQYADDRHHHKSTMAAEEPNVIIFCNEVPNWTKLTEDRWEKGLVMGTSIKPWSDLAASKLERIRKAERIARDIAATEEGKWAEDDDLFDDLMAARDARA